MNPMYPLTLLLLLLSLLHPTATALCAPRSLPYTRLLAEFLSAPSSLPTASSPKSPSPLPPKFGPGRSAPAPPKPTPAPAPPKPTPAKTQTLSISPPRPLARSPLPAVDGAVDASLKSICGKTSYADVCVSTILSMDPGVRNPDVRTVLKLEMKAATKEAKATLALAKKLAAQVPPRKDDIIHSIYSVCVMSYGMSFDDIDAAAEALERGDKGTLMSNLSGLFPDFTDCGDAFAESSIPSPFQAHEDMLKKLASNCLAIADQI